MATENVGGIQYTVDADTSDLITAEAATKKFTTNTAKSFATAEASTKRFNTQVSGTAKAARSARPDMQNMSYQLQDMAVQAQMGTSAFVIMAQQIPQMLVGMGAWAGAIGVAVTVLGLLATTTIDTTTDLQRLDSAVSHAKAVMTVGADGVVEYTEKMKELGRISQLVAEFQMATAMKKAQEGVKNAVKSMADELSKVDDTVFGTQFGFAVENSAILATNSMRNYTVTVGNLLGELGSASDETGDKAQQTGAKFIKLFADLNKAKTPEAVTDIQEEIIKMATASDKADKKFIKMIESLMFAGEGTEDYFTKLRALTAVLEEGAKSQTDFSNKTKETGGIMKDLTNEFTLNAIRLTEGERAAFKFSLQLKGLDEEQVKAQMSLYDYDQELKKNKEDQEASAKAAEDHKDKIKKLNDELDAYFDKESEDSTNKDRKDTATLTTQVQSIGLTPEEEIQARYDRELELLQQAEEKKIEIEGTYAERRTQIEAERLEALRNLNSDNIDFLSEAFSNLDTQIAGTMAQVVVGAKDGETAMRDLASTMITQVVGALVQQGVELVKNKVLGNVLATSEKANILSTTATGVAAQQTATASTTAAAATTATAAAPAAALTSTFSFGSAALIGGAALLGTLAISKMMASGAREFGGPVTAGKSYLVGERGPEMFTPNTSGGIVSNKDMAGSGSGVSVNINNYSGQDVTQNYDEVKKIVTVEIGKQISGIRSGTGAMAKALKGTTTNKGRATRA